MSDTYRPFSERQGYSEPRSLQREDMDDPLRNSLLNVFRENFPDRSFLNTHQIYRHIWTDFFKKSIGGLNEGTYFDTYVESHEHKGQVQQSFRHGKWFAVYDLVEFVVQAPTSIINDLLHKRLVADFNFMLERERSAFRIVNRFVTQITSKEEIESIEAAANASFAGVKEHIRQALAHLSNRKNPDYRNSITESINAVESLAKEVTGESKCNTRANW